MSFSIIKVFGLCLEDLLVSHRTASGQSLGSNGKGDALSEFRNAKQHTPT